MRKEKVDENERRTPKLRLWLVYLGFCNQLITMYGVILMTYILFRLSPQPHDILLNAVALEYIADFDKSMVQSFGYQPELRALLVTAQRDLAILADQQFETNVCGEIRDLETATFSTILISFFKKEERKSSSKKNFFQRLWSQSLHYYQAPQHRAIELISRVNAQAYLFISFTMWLLAFTGGHIAHSHVLNILWFFGLRNQRAKPESNRYPVNRVRYFKKQNPDAQGYQQYFLPAMIMICASYLVVWIIYYFLVHSHKGDGDGHEHFDPRDYEQHDDDRGLETNDVVTSLSKRTSLQINHRPKVERRRSSKSSAAGSSRPRRPSVLAAMNLPNTGHVDFLDQSSLDLENPHTA